MDKKKLVIKKEYLVKKDFLAEIATATEVTATKVEAVLNKTGEIIQRELEDNKKVVVPGLGFTFKPAFREGGEKMTRNPQTNQSELKNIADKYVIKVKPTAKMADLFNKNMTEKKAINKK